MTGSTAGSVMCVRPAFCVRRPRASSISPAIAMSTTSTSTADPRLIEMDVARAQRQPLVERARGRRRAALGSESSAPADVGRRPRDRTDHAHRATRWPSRSFCSASMPLSNAVSSADAIECRRCGRSASRSARRSDSSRSFSIASVRALGARPFVMAIDCANRPGGRRRRDERAAAAEEPFRRASWPACGATCASTIVCATGRSSATAPPMRSTVSARAASSGVQPPAASAFTRPASRSSR